MSEVLDKPGAPVREPSWQPDGSIVEQLGLTANQPRVAVLIPCRNEEAAIGKVVSDFKTALPDAVVNNSVGIGEVAGKKIDQAFIGACCNGTLDDLAVAARVVNGRQVARGTRFIVTPSTEAIHRAAISAGYVQTLMEAGAIVTTATCGACVGGHMGVLGVFGTPVSEGLRVFRGGLARAVAGAAVDDRPRRLVGRDGLDLVGEHRRRHQLATLEVGLLVLVGLARVDQDDVAALDLLRGLERFDLLDDLRLLGSCASRHFKIP